MEWQSIGKLQLDLDKKLRFPTITAEPGLYRFRLIERGIGRGYDFYIGETDNMKRRLQHIRTPERTQKTYIRVNERLREHMGNGGVVEIDVIMESARTATEERTVNLSDDATRRHLKKEAKIVQGGRSI